MAVKADNILAKNSDITTTIKVVDILKLLHFPKKCPKMFWKAKSY